MTTLFDELPHDVQRVLREALRDTGHVVDRIALTSLRKLSLDAQLRTATALRDRMCRENAEKVRNPNAYLMQLMRPENSTRPQARSQAPSQAPKPGEKPVEKLVEKPVEKPSERTVRHVQKRAAQRRTGHFCRVYNAQYVWDDAIQRYQLHRFLPAVQ